MYSNFKQKQWNQKKVWFITGASKGLGWALAKKLLAEGYNVAATSRNKESLIAAIGKKDKTFLPTEMDLTQNQDVRKAIEAILNHFNRLDVFGQ